MLAARQSTDDTHGAARPHETLEKELTLTSQTHSDNGNQQDANQQDASQQDANQQPHQANGSSDSGTGEHQADKDGDQVDYKAKYSEAIAHSREWEKRAKANKDAAAELQQLKDAQKTEAEKQAERLAELEAENAEFKAREDRAQWAAEIEETTGVPANALRGTTREEMEAHAEDLKPYFEAQNGSDSGDDGQQSSATKTISQAFEQTPGGTPQSTAAQIKAATEAGNHQLAAQLKASMLGATN